MSSRKLEKLLEQQLQQSLFQVVADLSNPKQARTFLQDFLGENELNMLVKRLAIATFLNEGHNYQDICKTVGVSSATVASVAERMDTKGMKLALQLMKVDAWAENMSKKFTRLLRMKDKKSS